RRGHTRFSRDWSSDVCSSDLFNFAISSSCSRVNFATFSVFGRLLPLVMPAAFLSSTLAGGVLVINVKLLSAYTVMTTGIGMPCRPEERRVGMELVKYVEIHV